MADQTSDVDRDAIYRSWSMAKFVAVVVGTVFLALFIITIFVAICVYCYRRKQKQIDDKLNYYDNLTCKSAPHSRQHTPKQTRRTSCPDLYRESSSSSADVADFVLPAERVQPKAAFENGLPDNPVLQQQYSFIGNSLPDILADRQTSDEEYDENKTSRGTISFSAYYDGATEKLAINLLGAYDLPGRGRLGGPRDPFVKVYLLPDEETCSLSKSCPNTLSPVFNEQFNFKVSGEDLRKRTLRLSVYDIDKKRVRHSLGHVFLSLASIDLDTNDVISQPLEKTLATPEALGDIQLSLLYMPNESKIKIVVNKARNIHTDNPNGVYVRIDFYHWRRLCKTKTTATKKGTLEPEFNESFSFTVRSRQLESYSVAVSVNNMIGGALAGDPRHGEVILGPFTISRGEQLQHWTDMLSNPREIVTKWHRLSLPPTSQ